MLGHNREDFWEIPESIMGKFSSIIDTGLPVAIENRNCPSTNSM